jgi:hypothetical protein
MRDNNNNNNNNASPWKSTTTSSPRTWTWVYYAIANHLLWSTLAVASRYLQVYATPQTFQGMAILSVTKASSFVLLFLYNRIITTGTDTTTVTTTASKRNNNVDESTVTNDNANSAFNSRHKRMSLALLYGVTSTCRACFNIASMKYTLSYNISTLQDI